MTLKRFFTYAAFVLLFLIFIRPFDAQAALKPSVREEKVVLYPDSDPYEFHFTNLEKNAKLQLSSSDKAVIKIKDSKAVAVKAGKATVTAKLTQNDKTYDFKVKFTVKSIPDEKTESDYEKLAKKTVKRLESELIDRSGTLLNYGNGTYSTTRKMLDKDIFSNLRMYQSFTVVLSDLNLLRSEKEYLSMFPFLSEITFSKPTKNSNCYSVVVSNVKKATAFFSDEIAIDYALGGGNVSFLTKDEKALYKKIVKVAKKLKKDTDYETVKAIHDYIIKNCEYYTGKSDKNNMDRYRLESAVKTGSVVCSGYAKYFCALCKALGINARFVIGSSTLEQSGDHGWNIVEIGHKWYGVDVTWDDGGKDKNGKNKYKYKYFLIADEDMKKDHFWDESLYPKAVSKDLGIVYSDLEKYPLVSGKKETLSYVKDVAKKLSSSKSAKTTLRFRELTASAEVFSAVNKELNSYGSSLRVYWKDWDTDTAGPGWLYKITLYK